jgi:Ca2+-binding RTX toxin-like protein
MISGSISGGTGIDTLDYSAYDSAVTVDLAAGIGTGIQAGCSGIENITGSKFDDSLTGDGNNNIIEGGEGNDIINGGAGDDTYIYNDNWGNDTVNDNAGDNDSLDFSGVTTRLDVDLAGAQIESGTDMVSYHGIENITGGSGDDRFYIAGSQSMNLNGGAGNDSFIFSNQGLLIGIIDGGSGNDVIDYSGDLTTILDIRVFVLTSLGSQDGFAGLERATLASGFTNIDTINGGLGMDTLRGLNADAQFDIFNNRVEYSTGDHLLTTTMIENLVGGDGDDTFSFHGDAQLPGNHNTIDGQGGQDTLDYSQYGAGVVVRLIGGVSTGVKDGVHGIENVVGSQYNDELYGDNQANILNGGAGDDKLYGQGGDDILIGGSGNDILDGGTGRDTVDYSGNTSAGVIISLLTGQATGEESGDDTLINLENVIGTRFADEITGDNNDNIIAGNGGNDTLAGLQGNDIYVFAPEWGTVTVIDSSGIDCFDFSGLNSDLTFTIGSALLTITDGVNTVNNTGVEIENLRGGSGNDIFKFEGSGTLKGSLDGGAGDNKIDLSGYQTGTAIILSGFGSKTGYAGSSSIISGGFDNVTALVGSEAQDWLSGFNVDSIWTLDGDNNSYTVKDSNRFISFSGFEKLQGGNLTDRFIIKPGQQAVDIQAGGGNDSLEMEDGSILAGRFDGQGGYDTLDYRNVTGSIMVQLSGQLGYTDGFNGTISSVADGFANIQAVLGGSGSDQFYGRDAEATFNLDTSGGNYKDAASQRVIDFTGFESLYGGSAKDIFNISGSHSADLYGQDGDDTFRFLGTGTLNGFIDGGSGFDILEDRKSVV